MPDLKTNFAVNLSLKLIRTTVANADTGNLKSLCTLFDTYLDRMLAKFEPNRMVQNVQNSRFRTKKPNFFKTNFDKQLTPFCKMFL